MRQSPGNQPMKPKTNKWGDSFQKNTVCECSNQVPDDMFFNDKGIYCHCKHCGGEIYYEKKA